MAAAAAERGKKALAVSDYESAIKQYSIAIAESPTSPDFFIQRSTAYLRANQAENALKDAEQAVLNGRLRAKREAITEAQTARGKALYKLKRYADAQFVFEIVKQRLDNAKAGTVDIWLNKCRNDLSKLSGDDLITNIKEVPDQPAQTESTTSAKDSLPVTDATTAQSAAPQQTPADKIRHEWYQSLEQVYITILAKGVSKEKTKFEFLERSVSVDFPLETHGTSFDFHLEPLFGPINTEKSLCRVLPSKVEIVLVKAQPGVKWSALESSQPIDVSAKADTPVPNDSGNATADAAAREAVLNPVTNNQKGPSYPTSSKSGPKNWDKIGEGEEEDVEGDPANHFFKKLFKDSSPDVQRAMMKSYQESNGTALSTNWEEVSKGKVQTLPPDGMEAKEYPK